MKTQKYHRRLIFTEFGELLDTYDMYKEKEFEIKYQSLLDHIGELSTEIYKSHNEINELFELNNEKARRINKAIKYIEKGLYSDYGDKATDDANKLLNILKGSDNND